jgi:hypothetical protein
VAVDRKGKFVLRSGRGRVVANRGKAAIHGTLRSRALPGTQVMVTVDCD